MTVGHTWYSGCRPGNTRQQQAWVGPTAVHTAVPGTAHVQGNKTHIWQLEEPPRLRLPHSTRTSVSYNNSCTVDPTRTCPAQESLHSGEPKLAPTCPTRYFSSYQVLQAQVIFHQSGRYHKQCTYLTSTFIKRTKLERELNPRPVSHAEWRITFTLYPQPFASVFNSLSLRGFFFF